ncbi:MAG: FMN-binding protein, partial [Pseudohongiellaceae bacterium]
MSRRNFSSYRRPSLFFRKVFLLLLSLGLFLTGLLAVPAVHAQRGLLADAEMLHRVMPDAETFSEKSGEPPVYRAYRRNASGEPELVGYLFETPDLPPEEIGYSAPIDVLVGMNLEGVLTGIQILDYRESYRSIRGDFLATERFPNQFEDKDIAEGFRVGRDVDGVSRATISSWAVARGIRNAARRIAEAYLADAGFVA